MAPDASRDGGGSATPFVATAGGCLANVDASWHVEAIVSDGATAYFTLAGGDGALHYLASLPLDGSSPAHVLATGAAGATRSDVAVDGSDVYFFFDGELRRVAKSGGDAVTFYRPSAKLDSLRFASDDDGIYFIDGHLVRAPKSGAAPVSLAAGSHGVAEAITVDASSVAWILRDTTSPSTPSMIFVMTKGAPGVPTPVPMFETLKDGAGLPLVGRQIALGPQNVYAAFVPRDDVGRQTLAVAPRAGGFINWGVSGDSINGWIAQSDGWLYFASESDFDTSGGISRVPIGGGSTSLVRGVARIDMLPVFGVRLAVDATNVVVATPKGCIEVGKKG